MFCYHFTACIGTPLKLRKERKRKAFSSPPFKHHFLCMQVTWTLQLYSQASWRQNKRKNRRKDLQLFQKMELKYVKQGSADCQNTGGFLLLPPRCIVSGVWKQGERGSIGISGFLFHHETLAQEILIVDPCGQDLEILPSQSFLVPECSWNWLWLPVTWLLYPNLFSQSVSGMQNGLEG